MRLTYISEERDCQIFATKAAKHFENHPKHYTYTEAEVKEGCFFAVRWGLSADCVLMFKLDEFFVPIVYQGLIETNKEKK